MFNYTIIIKLRITLNNKINVFGFESFCIRLYKYFLGILLHGPPGCGKTLIAKAMAREAGTHFINLDLSILTDKWYGESQKLAAAVFTLAVKIQPCIVFIDEIDSFLRTRKSSDHEVMNII